MASIVGEKYKSADGKGVAILDKIFGYADKAGDIYNEIRYPKPGDTAYVEAQAQLRKQQAGMFGLPKPWGLILLLGGVSLLGFGIYKIAVKK